VIRLHHICSGFEEIQRVRKPTRGGGAICIQYGQRAGGTVPGEALEGPLKQRPLAGWSGRSFQDLHAAGPGESGRVVVAPVSENQNTYSFASKVLLVERIQAFRQKRFLIVGRDEDEDPALFCTARMCPPGPGAPGPEGNLPGRPQPQGGQQDT